MSSTVKPDALIVLLRADPHRWGSGLVHQIDLGRDQILCGKTPANCPGTRFEGPATQITCKACLRSIAAKERYEQLSQKWAEETNQRED